MDYVIFYSTDAQTGKVTEIKHYLTPEEIAEYKAQQAQDNKQQAKTLLEQSDWATRPSVADPAISNPYLANQADFFDYQNALRQIVFNPPDTKIEFPPLPKEVWETVEPTPEPV
jgi:hypothetical protein